MIKYRFLGLYRNTGTFTDKKLGEKVPFDNAVLHFAVSGLPKTICDGVASYEVKGRRAEEVLGCTLAEFAELAPSIAGHVANLVFVPSTDGNAVLGMVDIE